MKIIKKTMVLLISIFLLSTMFVIPINALPTTTTQDGLQVELSTDKDSYNNGDKIEVTLTVTNTNNFKVNNITLEQLTPEGFQLTEGQKTNKEIDSLEAGDSISLSVTYTLVDSNTNNSINQNNGDSNISAIKTGDNSNFVILFTLLILSTSGVIIISYFCNKKDKRLFSIFLCLMMIFALMPITSVNAEENYKKISITHEITVNSNTISLSASIIYNGSESYIEDFDHNGDGIPDCIMDEDKTTDTDKDGISDYNEFVYTNTNPNLADTNGNGISDADEDPDSDLLTNIKELELNTNPLLDDTDDDDLNDGDEITYSTDPLNKDTDGDGANDHWEINNGFDPLIYNESFNVKISNSSDNITANVNIDAAGEIASTITIEKAEDNLFLSEDLPGYIASAFEFSADGEFDQAVISFTFDEKLLSDNFLPAIYYFNEDTQLLEELETSISGNTASTTVTHFSTYILLNKTEFDTVWDTYIKPPEYTGVDQKSGLDVVLAIDSSGSMSSNDANGLRKEAAKLFVDKLGENDRAAIVDFDGDANTLIDLSNDKEQISSAIDSINSSGATDLTDAISTSIKILTNDDVSKTKYKYIILLTDGNGNYNSNYSQIAVENDITIFTIGLGNSVNSNMLKEIADYTGGNYYFASKAEDLLGIYENTAGETIDYITDSNNDGISDYYTKLLCEHTIRLGSGKNNPFKDISYDDIQANDDYDGDGLVNGQELLVKNDETTNKTYIYMVSNPTSIDSEKDGILDNEDDAPLIKGYADGSIGELTIASDDNGTGHSWLVYKSYVNTDLNIEKIDGYILDSKKENFEPANDNSHTYKVSRNESISFGSSSPDWAAATIFLDGEISYNREFYELCIDSKLYNTSVGYTRKITNKQLNDVMKYLNNNNYYSVYSHNCSHVALEAWEKAYGKSDGFYNQLKDDSHFIYSIVGNPTALKESILKKEKVDKKYHKTMLKIIQEMMNSK